MTRRADAALFLSPLVGEALLAITGAEVAAAEEAAVGEVTEDLWAATNWASNEALDGDGTAAVSSVAAD